MATKNKLFRLQPSPNGYGSAILRSANRSAYWLLLSCEKAGDLIQRVKHSITHTLREKLKKKTMVPFLNASGFEFLDEDAEVFTSNLKNPIEGNGWITGILF